LRRVAVVLVGIVVSSLLHAESISGAGGTFPDPLYQRWIETFLGNRANDHIVYDAVGSGQGIARLLEGRVDFAASDVCDEALFQKNDGSSQASNVLCIPVAAGAVVPIFNLAGVSRDLRVTAELLADIYLGKITKWNDPKIRAVNHSASLPDRNIVVVHRGDSSGTTYAFSEYLSLSSDEWHKNVGKGLTLAWPVGSAAETNDGVAQLVQKTDGAIGYTEFLYALRHHLGMIEVRNRAGHYVQANLETIGAAAAAANSDLSSARGVLIEDASGSNVYPLSTFTYMLLLKDAAVDSKRKLLLDFLSWALDSGQRQAAALGYVAVPSAIAAKARSSLTATN
jgi:phosphate transport system substrate-binding protein